MMKAALLLGTMLLSSTPFAASVSDLNAALHKTTGKPTQNLAKILYGGRDLLRSQVANMNQAIWEAPQKQVG